jgi:hypothetical protein
MQSPSRFFSFTALAALASALGLEGVARSAAAKAAEDHYPGCGWHRGDRTLPRVVAVHVRADAVEPRWQPKVARSARSVPPGRLVTPAKRAGGNA